MLRAEDVDEEMFIFPDKGNADEATEKEEMQEALRSTQELLAPFIERQTKGIPNASKPLLIQQRDISNNLLETQADITTDEEHKGDHTAPKA